MSTEQKKFNFLKKVYFGVSDNPKDDVNPFIDLDNFGLAKVSEMSWGINHDAIQRSKLRFSHNYHRVLGTYNVELLIEDIFSNLKDDLINDEVITEWLKCTKFPE